MSDMTHPLATALRAHAEADAQVPAESLADAHEPDGLPDLYAELYTKDCPAGRCHYASFVNHRTPSGSDRPWVVSSSNTPLLLDRLIDALRPGVWYLLDGQWYRRDERPVIPYTEKVTP